MGKKRAGEAAMLNDALSQNMARADTDDSSSAETERIERKSRQKKQKSAVAVEEEVADASKQRREKDSDGKNGKKVKKKPTKHAKELLAELKDFNEADMKSFRLWQKQTGVKTPAGQPPWQSPAAPVPSAPRGRGKHNLPKKTKRRKSLFWPSGAGTPPVGPKKCQKGAKPRPATGMAGGDAEGALGTTRAMG